MAHRTRKPPTQQPFKIVIEETTMPYRGGHDRPPRFPFDQLTPATRLPDGRYKGPSFFIPESMERPITVRAAANAYSVKTRKEFQFATRVVEENGEKGVRIWRRPTRVSL